MLPQIRPYERSAPLQARSRYIGLAHSAPADVVCAVLVVAILVVLATAAGLRP
jgi:hypothetical protein